MPVFESKAGTHFVISSYKVMYSTLASQETLRELSWCCSGRLLLRKFIKKRHASTFQLVRNPYDRVRSLFSDKFRKEPRRIHKPEFYWQGCHQVLFPYLDLTGAASDNEKAEAFLNFSFADFLKLLPAVWTKEAHYHPQHFSTALRWRGRYWPVRWPVTHVFRMETDLPAFAERTRVDIGTRRNPAPPSPECNTWTPEMRRIVNSLYRRDFQHYHYEQADA